MIPHAKTILLVDDDGDDALLFKEALKRADATISLSRSTCCDSAMKLLNSSETLPDYIFLDINMPMVSGLDCLALLKKSKRLKDIPVIMCTTSSRDADVAGAKSLGAVMFFTKPPSFDVLVEILRFIFRGIPLTEKSFDAFMEIFPMP